MQSKHDKKIVFSGIDMVGARLNNSFECYKKIEDELQPLMISSGYLEGAPFLWVGIIFCYGLKTEIVPHYERINKKYGDLPLTKELDMRVLLTADETDVNLLKELFLIATLDALIHAGKKYKLKIDALLERRNQLGNIPEWDPAMDDRPELLDECYKMTLPKIQEE